MVFEKIKFLAANIAPKPDEVSYWVDISANPYGGVIKYYDGYDWIKLDQDSIAEDYLKLRNKPTLNGVVIEGNKTSKDYNIPTPESVELVLNDFRNEINNIDEKVSNVSIKLDNYIEANDGNIEDIKQDIVNIQESLELILGESASEVIDKFNEILSFLEGYDDSQTLKGVISDLETKLTELINNVEDDLSLLEKEIKATLDSHLNNYNNPHQVTKQQIGLDQVDNTSDLNKPISTLTQQALDYEANLRDEMDTELMNRINVLQGKIDSASKKIVTDIIDITQNNTSGVQLNYKYKDRVSFDDKYSDEKSASVLLNNASSTNNGVMSKEDKKKFDSIDSKITNDITSITYEPSNIKINYGSQNLQDGVYVKSSETKIINSATTSSAGAMSSEDKQTLDAVKTTYIPLNQKGVANGVATLDENALIPSSQLPSYVDDVIECFATFTKNEDGSLSDISLYEDEEHSISITGEAGKIYVDITVRTVYNRAIEEGVDPIMTLAEEQAVFGNYQFRWTGTQFAVINASTVIGTIPGTAFDGGRGKQLEDLVNVINGSSSIEGSFRKADSDLQATINESISLLRDDINENVTSISEITNQINTINSNIQDVINGNVASATKLQTARLINGTAFDGTADIITNSWGEARNITIGNTKKSVNGSTDVSWSLEEIGMDTYTKTEADDRYVNVSGDTMTGGLTLPDSKYYGINGEFGLNLNNSDIIGLNGLYWRDSSDDGSEGINFYRDSSHWDTLFAKGGKLYFNPNRANEDTSSLGNEIWHAGNDGSGSGLDADLLDGKHLEEINKNTGYTWSSIYKINSWSRILTIHGYSNILLALTFSQNSQASAHLYLISTGYSTGNIIQIGANNFSGNSDIQIRLTATESSTAFNVEIYGKYSYNGVTDVQLGCKYICISPQCEISTYTSYTPGDGNAVKTITSSYYKIVSDLAGNADSATKLQTPRTIWGQSFDGTQNIVNPARMQYVEFSAMSGTRAGYVGRGAGSNDNIYIASDLNKNIILLTNGNIGVGTDSPSYKLHVNGVTKSNAFSGNNIRIECENDGTPGNRISEINNFNSNLYLQYATSNHLICCVGGGNVGIGTKYPSQKLHVEGNVLATGFYEESDVRLKTNIQPIDFTNNIELVSFNWKKDGSKSYGVIAQQVEQYYPELVSTDESTGYKSVNYDAVLIIKCAQLENRIKQLEKELEDLKNE